MDPEYITAVGRPEDLARLTHPTPLLTAEQVAAAPATVASLHAADCPLTGVDGHGAELDAVCMCGAEAER